MAELPSPDHHHLFPPTPFEVLLYFVGYISECLAIACAVCYAAYLLLN
jgi:hypothetical protein